MCKLCHGGDDITSHSQHKRSAGTDHSVSLESLRSSFFPLVFLAKAGTRNAGRESIPLALPVR